MSKYISPAMQAHLNSGATNFVMCWRLTPVSSYSTIGFTEHHQDIIYKGIAYQAKSGLSTSAVKQSDELSPNNIDADFFLNLNDKQAYDFRAGIFDTALCDFFLIDALQPALGIISLLRGSLSTIQFSRGQAGAQIDSLSARLQQNLLERSSPTCRANLGDNRCRVKLAAFTVTGIVMKATNNNQVFIDDKRTEATNHFNQGLLTWLSGNNQGLCVDIKRFTKGGTFLFFEPLFKPISLGDRYQVVRGCDKTVKTCETVFNNVVNFRGEPHLPGNDQIFKVGA